MKKRVLAIAMSLAMTLSLLPVSALAVEDTGEEHPVIQQETDTAAENTAEEEAPFDIRDGETVTVFTEEDLLSALGNGDADNVTVVLNNDIVLEQELTMYSGSFVLDMNENTLTYGADLTGGTAGLIDMHGTAELTVTGNGVFTFNDDYMAEESKSVGYTFRLDDNTHLTIQNGTFHCGLTCVQLDGSSAADIYSGEFSAEVAWNGEIWILNKIDSAKKSTTFRVYGGTFTNYDPSYSVAENPPENFCADGYVSVQDGENYVVKPIADVAVAQVGDTYYLTLAEAIENASNNQTVTLLSDVTENDTTLLVKDQQAITLDLAGKNVSVNSIDITAGNRLTICDSSTGGTLTFAGTHADIEGGTVIVDSGTIESPTGYGFYVNNGGTVIVNGGVINSLDSSLAGNNTTGDMNFEVNGGTLTAQRGPAIYMPGQIILTVTGGTLNGGISLRMGQVNISGGTINATTGSIDSIQEYYNYSGNAWLADALYVFNGTYTSENGQYGNSLNLNITGGTFNCTNGQGSAIAIYDIGKVEQESKVTISGNAKLSTTTSGRNAYDVLSLPQVGVTNPASGCNNPDFVGDVATAISGGYFTSDPSDYLAGNYYAVASDKDGYAYMVTDQKPQEAPVIVTENVEAEVAEGANMTSEDKNAVLDVINSASVSGVADALTDPAKNEIVTKANISSEILDDPDQTVVIEIGVNVTATSAKLSGDDATVTYQVTPVATVKVKGEEQPEKVSVPNSYLNGQKFTVRLPLPKGLKDPQEVMHIADNGTRERFTGSELNIEPNWVEVNISHFSELIVNARETVAAKIGDTQYGTLQEAVSAAKSGDVIVLQQNCNEPITISGKSVTINKNGYIYSDSLVSVGANCTKTVSGNQIIVTYTAPSRPSGGGSSSSDSGDYLISVDRVSGGRVTVQPGRADKGDTVTITVYPNDGYELDELVVTDSRGNEIDLDARGSNRFTFTMPGGKVTVEASFIREGGQTQTPQTTFADVPASAWYYNAVEYVYENGLMSGVSGGRFAPDDTLTRAMLVQTLYAMEGRPASASAGFADVASGDWYASAVNWAAANGVVSGVSETGFGPNNALTREQLALILYRFAQYKGYDVTGTSDLAAYADGSSVSGWAAEAMGWAVDAGLISGVGGNQIAPTGTASRAQVAQILMNFCENVAH